MPDGSDAFGTRGRLGRALSLSESLALPHLTPAPALPILIPVRSEAVGIRPHGKEGEPMRTLLALVTAVALGCVAPRVDVDTSGLRPSSRESSASRPSSSAATSAETQELKKDLDKVEEKVGDLEGTVKKLDERLKKLEKKSD